MTRVTTPRIAAAESLESRRLLSAQVVDSVLVVTGTNGPERIRVWEAWEAPAQVIVLILPIGSPDASQRYDFPFQDVRSVLVRAGAGDDTVDLYSAPLDPGSRPLSLPARVDAGLGNDVVLGSRQRDFLYGSFGNDRILGEDGDDWVDGGWGDDTLSGGDGNDAVYSGYGNDSVSGDRGNDRLYGGAGDDHVGFVGDGVHNPEPGSDLLVGGPGEDWMSGGTENDFIYGGTGRDHFSLLDADHWEIRDRFPNEPQDVPIVPGRGYLTFAFRGTVTSVSLPHGMPFNAPPVDWPPPGSEVRGTITFDPNAPDGYADPRIGSYTSTPDAPVRVEIGQFRWAAPASGLIIQDSPAGDTYDAGAWIPGMQLINPPEVGWSLDRWNFRLSVAGDDTLLDGDRLPLTPPLLENATTKTLTLVGDSSLYLGPIPFLTIEATLDSLTLVQPAPPR